VIRVAIADLTKKANNIDWQKMQTMLSPAGMSKLDAFLDRLIKRGGNAFYLALCAWGVAMGIIFLTFMYTAEIKTLEEDLAKTVAATPLVPTINMIPIDATELQKYVERLNKTYPRINAREIAAGAITVKAQSIQSFNQWRGFIRDLQYGGPNWRVTIQSLCTGRNCAGTDPLIAMLKVDRLEILQPTPPET
jgi:hypothetical protein